LLREFLKFLSQKSMKELEFPRLILQLGEKNRESMRENDERGEKEEKHPSSSICTHKLFSNYCVFYALVSKL